MCKFLLPGPLSYGRTLHEAEVAAEAAADRGSERTTMLENGDVWPKFEDGIAAAEARCKEATLHSSLISLCDGRRKRWRSPNNEGAQLAFKFLLLSPPPLKSITSSLMLVRFQDVLTFGYQVHSSILQRSAKRWYLLARSLSLLLLDFSGWPCLDPA